MGVEEAIIAYIFCGGEFCAEGFALSEKADFSIAADSGIHIALTLGIVPDMFIGDFDSFDKTRLSESEKEAVKNIPSVTYPVKKDLTDSAIAIETALEKGADKIYIFGALGGRLDHTLSNVFLLKYIKSRGASAVIDNGHDAVRYLENESTEIKARYKYLSILAYCGDAYGVTVEGAEYPLDNAVIKQLDPSYAVSNRIIGEKCRITVNDGGLLVVESNE
ncbi:MAG: thiamine diphosphokinase [Clostridia bacterium]|nr:thiamine diphosphokinase [Clostridia bacterium]